jgi:hypothetical protein
MFETTCVSELNEAVSGNSVEAIVLGDVSSTVVELVSKF